MASTSTRFQRWLLVRGTRKGTGVSTAVSSPSTTIVALEGGHGSRLMGGESSITIVPELCLSACCHMMLLNDKVYLFEPGPAQPC